MSQSKQELEQNLIQHLTGLGYESVKISSGDLRSDESGTAHLRHDVFKASGG
jgi:hypothetical protein